MDERLDKVKVQCDYLPLINFAMQQNGASIIHQISIENTTHAPLKDVQVQITTEPAFGNAVPTVIEAIPANDRVCLQTFNLTLSTNYFTQLTERLSGSLKVEITSETKAIFSQTYPIDILAYDQWADSMSCPKCWLRSSLPIMLLFRPSSNEPLPFWSSGQEIRHWTNTRAVTRTG